MGKGQAEGKIEKKADNNKVILRVDMDCEACKQKVRKVLKKFPGVENIDLDMDGQKVTVKGNVDAWKVYEALKKKCGKRTALVYPQFTEEEARKAKEDAIINSVNNIVDSITDLLTPKPPDTIVELKVRMHCGACAKKIKRILSRMDGVLEVEGDMTSDKVVVKGRSLDAEALCERVKQSGKQCEVVSIKKEEKPQEKKGEKKEEKTAEKKEQKEEKAGKKEEKEEKAGKKEAKEEKAGNEEEKEEKAGKKEAKEEKTVKPEEKEEKTVNPEEKEEKAGDQKKDEKPGKKKGQKKGENKEEKKGKEGEKQENQGGEKTEEEKEEGKPDEKKEGKNGSKKEKKGEGKAQQDNKEAVKPVGQSGQEGEAESEIKQFVYTPYQSVSEYAYAPQIFSDENPNACCVM